MNWQVGYIEGLQALVAFLNSLSPYQAEVAKVIFNGAGTYRVFYPKTTVRP